GGDKRNLERGVGSRRSSGSGGELFRTGRALVTGDAGGVEDEKGVRSGGDIADVVRGADGERKGRGGRGVTGRRGGIGSAASGGGGEERKYGAVVRAAEVMVPGSTASRESVLQHQHCGEAERRAG